jgi:hypothetical protein
MLTPSANRGDEHAQGGIRKPENALQTVEQREVDRLEAPAKKPKDVWSIPTKLQAEERTWDSAMFNLAINNKPRARDVLRPEAEGVVCRHDRRSRHGPRENNRTSRPIEIERAVMTSSRCREVNV